MELNEPSAKYLVAAGFKRSEVGDVPVDWNVSTIGALAVTSSGTTPPRSQPERYYVNGTVPWVKTLDLNNGLIHETDEKVTVAALKETSLQPYPAGSVLVAMYGGYNQIGRTGLLTQSAAVNQAITAVRPKPGQLDSGYLLRVLNFRVEYWKAVASSSRKDPNITSKDVRAFPLAAPALDEQRAIAIALADADALIESLEQLLAKKRQIKQGAMQELLTGQRRLPGFSDGWTPAKLEDLADIRSGGTPSTQKAEFWDGDILWCTPTDITALNGSKYLTDTHRKITAMGMKACSADLIPANSIVMTSRATIGECAINLAPLCTNQGFKNFVPFPHVDVQFLYYMLTTQKAGFISLCGGSTFLEIGKTQLRPYEVSMPPTKDEQTAIATVLSDMDTEITALEARLTKARQLKQGMAQALLTGRIRLVN